MPIINHRPKKSLGQNFLVDGNIARKIVSSLTLTHEDHVMEIGAGRGILTKYLVASVQKLVAVEIDRNLCQALRAEFNQHPNFELVEDNFLDLSLEDHLTSAPTWKIVGNIPYHLTSPIIFKIFKFRRHVQSLILMVQKEVAQRIVAKPGTKTYGILSVLSQLFADVNILFSVSKHVFRPRPKVDSAIVRWNFLPQNRFLLESEEFFLQMVKAVFGQRRKLIKNSLTAFGINTESIDFPLTKRPEQLTVAEFVQLSNLITYGRDRH